MVQRSTCPVCQGSGVQMVQTSSMFGLLKRDVPASCGHCAGLGHLSGLPTCKVCDGHGLVGNESEICRTCNGTGKVDTFALIPTELLTPGTIFERRCEHCDNSRFEIMTPIEPHKLTRTWDAVEELREVEIIDRVRVACSNCGNAYYIQIDPTYHQEVTDEMAVELERLGLNLGFLYQVRDAKRPAALPAEPQA